MWNSGEDSSEQDQQPQAGEEQVEKSEQVLGQEQSELQALENEALGGEGREKREFQ